MTSRGADPSADGRDLADRWAQSLADEAVKARRAKAAVLSSIDSIHIEARRLQDSREISRRLADQVSRNNFTERIAASMRTREAK